MLNKTDFLRDTVLHIFWPAVRRFEVPSLSSVDPLLYRCHRSVCTVQTVRRAAEDHNSPSSERYLLLRLPLSAAIKKGSFVVQLAQDHVVLEEKSVSHAESAERNQNMEVGLVA